MNCTRCGARMNPREAFCGSCGASMYTPATGFGDRYETQGPLSAEVATASKRTAGMVIVAILNLLLGGFPILSALAAFGAPNTVNVEWPVVFLSAVGVIGIIAGIGVLVLASWGKTMSLFFVVANLFIILVLGAITWRKVDWGYAVYLAVTALYGVTVILLFQKPGWKQTFSAAKADRRQ